MNACPRNNPKKREMGDLGAHFSYRGASRRLGPLVAYCAARRVARCTCIVNARRHALWFLVGHKTATIASRWGLSPEPRVERHSSPTGFAPSATGMSLKFYLMNQLKAYSKLDFFICSLGVTLDTRRLISWQGIDIDWSMYRIESNKRHNASLTDRTNKPNLGRLAKAHSLFCVHPSVRSMV